MRLEEEEEALSSSLGSNYQEVQRMDRGNSSTSTSTTQFEQLIGGGSSSSMGLPTQDHLASDSNSNSNNNQGSLSAATMTTTTSITGPRRSAVSEQDSRALQMLQDGKRQADSWNILLVVVTLFVCVACVSVCAVRFIF